MKVFNQICEKHSIMAGVNECFRYMHQYEQKHGKQMALPGFD